MLDILKPNQKTVSKILSVVFESMTIVFEAVALINGVLVVSFQFIKSYDLKHQVRPLPVSDMSGYSRERLRRTGGKRQ